MYLTRLINSASNCYMNSALQGLSSCPKLIEEFEKLTQNYKSINSLLSLNQLLQALTNGKTSVMNVRQNPLFQNWKKTGQQDSFEILSYIIGEVYKKIKKKHSFDEWFVISLPLRIIMGYEIECSNGHQISCPKQGTLALHVPIPENLKIYTIQNLLNKFMEESEIEDYICDECISNNDVSGEINAKKLTNILLPLPNTICIHLQRTRWKNGSMKKINDKIKIDEEILIKYKNNSGQLNEKQYYLKSVIVHSGTPFFGHYICYKKVENIWYYTSDNSIRSVRTKSVPYCQAYILFYEQSESPET